MAHALQPTGTFGDDLFVVTTAFQGRATSMPDLGAQLADEVTHRQSLLDAREREVLREPPRRRGRNAAARAHPRG